MQCWSDSLRSFCLPGEHVPAAPFPWAHVLPATHCQAPPDWLTGVLVEQAVNHSHFWFWFRIHIRLMAPTTESKYMKIVTLAKSRGSMYILCIALHSMEPTGNKMFSSQYVILYLNRKYYLFWKKMVLFQDVQILRFFLFVQLDWVGIFCLYFNFFKCEFCHSLCAY